MGKGKMNMMKNSVVAPAVTKNPPRGKGKKALKASVPRPILKVCLDEMAVDDNLYLLFKYGKSTDTCLYYVDNIKLGLPSPGEWACPTCTLRNKNVCSTCGVCATKQPSALGSQSKKRAIFPIFKVANKKVKFNIA